MNGEITVIDSFLSTSVLEEYQKFAPYYREVGLIRGHFDMQVNFLKEILINNVNLKVLDASCATGDVLKKIAIAFPSFTLFGSDGCSDFISQAKVLSNRSDILFSHSKWCELRKNFDDNSFDFIFILGNSIGHISSIEEFVNILVDIRHLLKKGGRFIFDLRNWDYNIRISKFNEPYGNFEILNLENDLKYKTTYSFENKRHYLTHNIYREKVNLKNQIELSFFDFSSFNIEDIIKYCNYSIVSSYNNFTKYPFLAYQIKK